MKKRLACLFCCFLILLLPACGKETKRMDAYIGEENYEAPVAYLSKEEVADIGEGILYREIPELEKFVSAIGLPVLLCIYQEGHKILAELIPYMEELAEKNSATAAVVMVKNTAQDPFLKRLPQAAWPYFALIKDGKKEAEYLGFTEETRAKIEAYVKTGGK